MGFRRALSDRGRMLIDQDSSLLDAFDDANKPLSAAASVPTIELDYGRLLLTFG